MTRRLLQCLITSLWMVVTCVTMLLLPQVAHAQTPGDTARPAQPIPQAPLPQQPIPQAPLPQQPIPQQPTPQPQLPATPVPTIPATDTAKPGNQNTIIRDTGSRQPLPAGIPAPPGATPLQQRTPVNLPARVAPDPVDTLPSLPIAPTDTTYHNPKNHAGDSLRFPIHDRHGDRLADSLPRQSMDLHNPANFHDSVEYDPKTDRYYVMERVGNKFYRTPTSYSAEEYRRLESKKIDDNYFRQRGDLLYELNHRTVRPKLSMNNNLFNRLFGNGKIDIKPQGNVDLLLGYQGQNVANPTLPESARKTGGLDFNMDANVNVLGNIGNKLKLPISYNTQATFDWMNQLKLEYTGNSDDIVKKIEAGNTSFTTKSTLMASEQSLFGIKAQLQFGKLFVTGVMASQRSQPQTTSLAGGAATTLYQFKADDYDENRHFLMAQYFRQNYNKAMAQLPIVTSQVQVLRLEVWVTNRNGATTQARQVVGLMDLGEPQPYKSDRRPSGLRKTNW